ncbi:MAG: Rieske 2Fe-2S domain-containing protein [Candidatus Korobacteraceae bacterium]|jgi:nitrite reductase/ring-hydroxylating ferredoxin subunit
MENSAKPDLRAGFPVDNLPDDGMILGQVEGEDVILARCGEELFAVGASCTHYHGPLADVLVVGETLRYPWHHACFSLRTGEALRAPALDPIACWRVEKIGGKAYQPVVQAADFGHGQRRTRVRGLAKDFTPDVEIRLL